MEVSSPGIDRPLRKLSDFERFAGEDVVIYLKPGQARSKEKGVLTGVEGEDVVVDQDGQPLAIPFATIKRAHIVGRIDFSGSGSKNVD